MMKEKAISFLKKNFFAVVIVLITAFLAWQNYDPGTWLSGWDTLHPEFNFPLNIKRAIFGVWRQEQGLGAVAVHSHMADLPRILFLYLASFFLPLSFLRYLYFFVCLALGPLGVYFFLEKIIFSDKPPFESKIASFLGGLFYLLNLGTLQHFYVPFEMFSTCYGFLPWLFLFSTRYLSKGRKKDIIIFIALTFLATPMAYAASLWYAFFACFGLYLLTFFIFGSRHLSGLKRLVIIIGASLIVNSYWLLPNLYLLKSSAGDVSSAKINQLFSAEAFLRDKKYATFENAAILKGFLFDWKGYNFKERGFVFLLEPWLEHLGKPFIQGLGWFFFSLILTGVLVSILERKRTRFLLPLFLFSFVFLVHSIWPASLVFNWLRDRLPFFREGLRFPWTKFSLVVMFCYAVFFAQAILAILSFFKKRSSEILLSLIFTAFFFAFMWPAFSGQLIDPGKRISLPEDYFETFDFFEKKGELERVATFPVQTFWGWEYYDWGFEGAGFLWFGLPQPVLTRDFDRWNPANENFYWQFSYALYSDNGKLLEAVLEKYNVNWLLVDQHVISVSNAKSLYFDELEDLLTSSEKVTLEKTFGKIKIYRVNLKTDPSGSTFYAQNLPVVGPTYNWNNFDKAYLVHGNYISTLDPKPYTLTPDIFYPFRSLFTGKNQEDLEFEIQDKANSFVFTSPLEIDPNNYQLRIPEYDPQELVWVDPENLANVRFLAPKVAYDQDHFEAQIPRVDGYLSYNNLLTGDLFSRERKNCDNFNEGTVKSTKVKENGKTLLQLEAVNANNCLGFWMPHLPHELSYLITLENRNLEGRSLRFWLENYNSRKPDLEIQTSQAQDFATYYFIQPPMEKDGLGYGFHFDNISIGQERAINDLGQVTVQPVPYKFLTGIFFEKEKAKRQVLVFPQSFDKNWVAYQATNQVSRIVPFLGQKINSHVLVNNWANGWVLEETNNDPIVIVFWPQYFEYFGFLLLVGLLIFVVVGAVKERKIS